MLFRCGTGKGLEPVGIMGSALLDSPILHRVGYNLRNHGIKLLALVNGLAQRLINLLG